MTNTNKSKKYYSNKRRKTPERLVFMSNIKTTPKNTEVQQEYANTRRHAKPDNTDVVEDFTKYLTEESCIDFMFPNPFELVKDNEIEFFKTEIPKALCKFLDYCDFKGLTETEMEYTFPDYVERISMPFTLSKHQFTNLQVIADNFNIDINQAILIIVLIVWNACRLRDDIKSRKFEDKNVPHLEPIQETNDLTSIISEDEIPF